MIKFHSKIVRIFSGVHFAKTKNKKTELSRRRRLIFSRTKLLIEIGMTIARKLSTDRSSSNDVVVVVIVVATVDVDVDVVVAAAFDVAALVVVVVAVTVCIAIVVVVVVVVVRRRSTRDRNLRPHRKRFCRPKK